MKEPSKFSTKNRVMSFRFAFKGLVNLVKREHNARIHLAAFFVVLAMSIYFDLSSSEWLSVLIVSGMVFMAELFNSSIEELSDVVEPEQDARIGLIKDYAAAAVLVAAIVALAVGAIIFIPKIFY